MLFFLLLGHSTCGLHIYRNGGLRALDGRLVYWSLHSQDTLRGQGGGYLLDDCCRGQTRGGQKHTVKFWFLKMHNAGLHQCLLSVLYSLFTFGHVITTTFSVFHLDFICLNNTKQCIIVKQKYFPYRNIFYSVRSVWMDPPLL